MSLIDELASSLGVEPERLRQCLTRAASDGKNAWTDSGGLRVSWARGRVVVQRYATIEATPAEILEADDAV